MVDYYRLPDEFVLSEKKGMEGRYVPHNLSKSMTPAKFSLVILQVRSQGAFCVQAWSM